MTGVPPPEEPVVDPRDALIREQARVIAAQAERIAGAGGAGRGPAGAAGRCGAGRLAEQRELLDAAELG